MTTFEKVIKNTFRFVGLDIRLQKRTNVDFWTTDKAFQSLYRQLGDNVLLSEVRCFILWQFVKVAARREGEAAEIGVYQGGTARLLSKTLSNTGKTLHLFDTFSGMPATDPSRDIVQEGDFRDTSLQTVREYLGDCENVEFHPGFFPDTGRVVEAKRFSFVHIDVDIYQSVKDCCEFFYPRMSPGGIMLMDDYGSRNCPGVRQAAEEFFHNKLEFPCYLPSGQSIVIMES